ncbi:MAG: hypothetical protein GX417_12355 [Clostridiales bacterium]|nr:hypothetical protein [Clostridiales bacterium]
MNEIRLTLAPCGAIMLRHMPERYPVQALGAALRRLVAEAAFHKRRTEFTEEPMYPEYNLLASPLLGASPTVGPHSGCLVPNLCPPGAANRPVEDPARPGCRPYCAKLAFASLLPRCPR